MKRLTDIAVPIAYFALCAVCLIPVAIVGALMELACFVWSRLLPLPALPSSGGGHE